MTTTPTACPAWCTDHSLTDENGHVVEHRALVEVGSIVVEVGQLAVPATSSDTTDAVVHPPDLLWVNGQELRDYITALTRAAALVEGHEVDELLCARCAPHAADSFDAGMRAGQRLGSR